MEMPTLCEHCKEFFDLNEGRGSKQFYPGITICKDCYESEAEYLQMVLEKEELIDNIEETKEELHDLKSRLQAVETNMKVFIEEWTQ